MALNVNISETALNVDISETALNAIVNNSETTFECPNWKIGWLRVPWIKIQNFLQKYPKTWISEPNHKKTWLSKRRLENVPQITWHSERRHANVPKKPLWMTVLLTFSTAPRITKITFIQQGPLEGLDLANTKLVNSVKTGFPPISQNPTKTTN